MSYDPEKPFPELDNSNPNTQLIYFLLEPSHSPPLGYSKLPTTNLYRNCALWVMQQFITNDDSVVSYLALTYFDNFMGHHPLPVKIAERTDRNLIIVTCCFILASKKRNPDFWPMIFLKKQGLNHMEEIIYEIGNEVDTMLQYRKITEPVTALCFLDYLTRILARDENVRQTIKRFASSMLHAFHADIRSTEFLPSIVAAVAIFFSVKTLYDDGAASQSIFMFLHCEHIDGKNLLLALEVFFPNLTVPIRDLSLTSSPPNLRLAAAQSRGRALLATMAQGNASTTATTRQRLLPPDRSPGPQRSHGSHTHIAQVKVPILVTAAEQHPDIKSGTSSNSSEHVRKDNGSSAKTDLLQVPAPDRSPGQNLDTDNRPMAVNADAQGTSYIMIGSIPVRIPPSQNPEFTNSRITTIGTIPIRIPLDNSDITGHISSSRQSPPSANSENVNTDTEANIVPGQNPADENATNEANIVPAQNPCRPCT